MRFSRDTDLLKLYAKGSKTVEKLNERTIEENVK